MPFSAKVAVAPEVILRTLQGRLKVSPGGDYRARASYLMIGRDGAVQSSADGGSTMPDAQVTSCVVRAFYGLSFPQPEGGIVTVVYPIMFAPGG